MKLLRSKNEEFVFRLNLIERRIFVEILNQYPLVPAAHQPLSKSIKGRKAIEDQHLLDEALAEQRAKHKRQLNQWLGEKGRFRRTKTGCTLRLRHEDAEWLLQILNDIRIGSWLLLGSPEEHMEPEEIAPELHRIWAAMEVCGMFQMAVLRALEGQSPN